MGKKKKRQGKEHKKSSEGRTDLRFPGLVCAKGFLAFKAFVPQAARSYSVQQTHIRQHQDTHTKCTDIQISSLDTQTHTQMQHCLREMACYEAIYMQGFFIKLTDLWLLKEL